MPAMRARDALDDCETETCACRAVGARSRFGRTRERLLEPLRLRRLDAGAAIRSVDARAIALQRRAGLDRACAVSERVVDEGGDQPRNRGGIEHERRHAARGEDDWLAEGR